MGMLKMLRTHKTNSLFYAINKFSPRSTYVHRRVTADKGLSALNLFILNIFSYPQNKQTGCKKQSFFTARFVTPFIHFFFSVDEPPSFNLNISACC